MSPRAEDSIMAEVTSSNDRDGPRRRNMHKEAKETAGSKCNELCEWWQAEVTNHSVWEKLIAATNGES